MVVKKSKNFSKKRSDLCDCSDGKKMKLDILSFAIAGGKVCGLMVALSTIAGIYGIMGGFNFLNLLIADIYGVLGYSVSWTGVLLGLIYGFIDGFIFFGLMAWIYNNGCLVDKMVCSMFRKICKKT